MIVSFLKYSTSILLLFFSVNTYAWACDGNELTETLQILHESLEVGYQIGLTGGNQNLWSRVSEISRRSQALSPSCQSLLEQVGQNLQRRYRPGTTNCHGDVCCDGSGCVSN